MTTDTEALRQKFERHIVATGRSDGELIFEAGHYLYPDVQEIWELYQAGHADAKAETADVGEPVAFAHFAANGNIRLWAPERPRDLDGNAAHPLYTADQLAAAVDAERSEHRHAMAVLRQIADMPRRTREQRLASACVRFLDAIRAGAKEPTP